MFKSKQNIANASYDAKKPEIKKKYVSSEMVGHHINATFQIYYYI